MSAGLGETEFAGGRDRNAARRNERSVLREVFMARQVNTKFVLTLSSVLTGLIAVVAVVYLVNRHHWQDPHVLMKEAADAENAGDINAAINNLTKALPAAREQHLPKC